MKAMNIMKPAATVALLCVLGANPASGNASDIGYPGAGPVAAAAACAAGTAATGLGAIIAPLAGVACGAAVFLIERATKKRIIGCRIPETGEWGRLDDFGHCRRKER